MQELNQYKELPTTIEEEEMFKAMEDMQLKVPDLGVNAFETPVFSIVPPQDAPPVQPTLTDIINNICAQLQLLTTVIGEQARNTTPSGENSLQECVETTLQQAEWFKDLVAEVIEERVDEHDFDDDIKGAVESRVEDYFNYRFDPNDHFDMNDLVADAVRDNIGDEVESRIDDALEQYMADAEFKLIKE